METRDKEIERLNRLLDGGRPVDAVLREGKKDSSERVVAHLNVQVHTMSGLSSVKNFTVIRMVLLVLKNNTILLLILLKFCICSNTACTCKHQP